MIKQQQKIRGCQWISSVSMDEKIIFQIQNKFQSTLNFIQKCIYNEEDLWFCIEEGFWFLIQCHGSNIFWVILKLISAQRCYQFIKPDPLMLQSQGDIFFAASQFPFDHLRFLDYSIIKIYWISKLSLKPCFDISSIIASEWCTIKSKKSQTLIRHNSLLKYS